MKLFRGLSLGPAHLLGHHTGAGLAIEIAAIYPTEVSTITLSGPAFMTPAEQEASYQLLAVGPFSKPEEDGSHLARVWARMNSELIGDLEVKMGECNDNFRAWKGRDQSYACTFRQDKIGYFKKVGCPVLGMCSKDDVLWDYFHYTKELVSRVQYIMESEIVTMLMRNSNRRRGRRLFLVIS
jgi:pimeloyl-ACP methyl ester carboxylesterase